MFGLSVRFTCRDLEGAGAFDKLVAETVTQIKENEPGTHPAPHQLSSGAPPIRRPFADGAASVVV